MGDHVIRAAGRWPWNPGTVAVFVVFRCFPEFTFVRKNLSNAHPRRSRLYLRTSPRNPVTSPPPPTSQGSKHFRNLSIFREKLYGVRVFQRCLRLLVSYIFKNSVINILQNPEFFIAIWQMMHHSANVESGAVQKVQFF